MTGKTITRAQLGESVYHEVGLSRNESAHLLETVLNHMSDALTAGDSVKISSFGTFKVMSKKERIGRNPKTKNEVMITSRKVVKFRPSLIFKEKINS